MTPLTLTLKSVPSVRVDLSPLTPDRLAGLTLGALRHIKLDAGNQRVAVDEIFKVSGRDCSHMEFHRASEKLVNIGAHMTRGEINVKGSVGDYLGRAMRGGTIRVRGDAGALAGNGMSGGLIEIHGSAGDGLGAANAGDAHGMNGGTIIVMGNAGERVANRMRRGIIIIKGNAGNYCGARMLAGTVLVLGNTGQFAGMGMQRGTIILGRRPKHISTTFNSCGTLKMQFLRIMFRHLTRAHRSLAILRDLGPLCDRYSGDLSTGGHGELMVLRGAYSY
jgi:formylmethanofuran dehydrogenase subunit C